MRFVVCKLSETVDKVIVDCSDPLSIVDERKDKVKEWTFTLLLVSSSFIAVNSNAELFSGCEILRLEYI